MDSVSIRVPYKNLRQEVELVGLEEAQPHHHQIEVDEKSRFSNGIDSDLPSSSSPSHPPPKHAALATLILSCTVAAGVQFGWALQLSLLTPYIQTLGIQHAFSSFIWLCGPITGLVLVLYQNLYDKDSSFGPFAPASFKTSIQIRILNSMQSIITPGMIFFGK